MTREGIYEYIARQKTSLISSVDPDGFPATRALIAPIKIEGNDIYFATYMSSKKVRDYLNNPKACVYFYEKGKQFTGVTIKGHMEVLNDQKTKDYFWRPFYKRFYRNGVTDPEYCILKFTGHEASYFCNYKVQDIQL